MLVSTGRHVWALTMAMRAPGCIDCVLSLSPSFTLPSSLKRHNLNFMNYWTLKVYFLEQHSFLFNIDMFSNNQSVYRVTQCTSPTTFFCENRYSTLLAYLKI